MSDTPATPPAPKLPALSATSAEEKLAWVRDYVDEDFDLHTSTIRGLLND